MAEPIEDWEYATLPDDWYKIENSEALNVVFTTGGKDSVKSESTEVEAGGYSEIFYLKNNGNKDYFTLKVNLTDYYVDSVSADSTKLSKSNTKGTTHFRLMYNKAKGTNGGYFIEVQGDTNNPKRVLDIVKGYKIGRDDVEKSYRWIFERTKAPEPPKADIAGSISSIDNIDNSQVKIIGQTNMSYLHVNVAGNNYEVPLYKIDPFHEIQNFDKTINLKTKITSDQKVTVYAVDVDEPSRRKEIGSDTVIVKHYNPEGNANAEVGDYNYLRFGGNAFDRDDTNASIEIYGYIYDSNNNLVTSFSTFTDKNNHRFEGRTTIPVPEETEQIVYRVKFEAIDVGGGSNVVIYDNCRTFENPIIRVKGIRLANGSYDIPDRVVATLIKENRYTGEGKTQSGTGRTNSNPNPERPGACPQERYCTQGYQTAEHSRAR